MSLFIFLRKHFWRAILLLFFLIRLFTPLQAKETKEISLSIQKIAYDYPIVTLKIRYPSETEWIQLHKNRNSVTLLTRSIQNSETTYSAWISSLTTKIYVEAFSFEGDRIAQSQPILIHAEDYLPFEPVLNPSLNEQVLEFSPLQGYVDTRASEVLVKVKGESLYSYPTNGEERFLLNDLQLPKGAIHIELVARNGWGESAPISWNALSLGDHRIASTFVLIDKDAFQLTYVKNGEIQEIFPIAIGTPRTPTLPGFWTIGKKQPMANPHTGWGVLRLLLYRPARQHKWSGYAIHGTNNPTSIGKEASHGCVRLFNKDILKLAQIVAVGTTVFVR